MLFDLVTSLLNLCWSKGLPPFLSALPSVRTGLEIVLDPSQAFHGGPLSALSRLGLSKYLPRFRSSITSPVHTMSGTYSYLPESTQALPSLHLPSINAEFPITWVDG